MQAFPVTALSSCSECRGVRSAEDPRFTAQRHRSGRYGTRPGGRGRVRRPQDCRVKAVRPRSRTSKGWTGVTVSPSITAPRAAQWTPLCSAVSRSRGSRVRDGTRVSGAGDEFVCSSSPAVEQAVRSLALDIQQPRRWTRQLFTNNVQYKVAPPAPPAGCRLACTSISVSSTQPFRQPVCPERRCCVAVLALHRCWRQH